MFICIHLFFDFACLVSFFLYVRQHFRFVRQKLVTFQREKLFAAQTVCLFIIVFLPLFL